MSVVEYEEEKNHEEVKHIYTNIMQKTPTLQHNLQVYVSVKYCQAIHFIGTLIVFFN